MQKLCGKKPANLSKEYDDMSDTEAIHLFCKTFENHQSIKEIRKNLIDKVNLHKVKLKHLFPHNR